MLNVLVVDDTFIMRNMVSKKLTELGHNVIGEAVNGEEAVAKYTELVPDLVTMDITMPEMNGLEALTAIMEMDPNATVMMITAHGEENKVIEAIKIGAKGYLLKPLTKEALEEGLRKIFPDE